MYSFLPGFEGSISLLMAVAMTSLVSKSKGPMKASTSVSGTSLRNWDTSGLRITTLLVPPLKKDERYKCSK